MVLVLDIEWRESKPPSMSIEDRTVVGIVDRGLSSTNYIPKVGGSRIEDRTVVG